MSATLYDEDDHNGTSVTAEMDVHGTLFLTLAEAYREPTDRGWVGGGESVDAVFKLSDTGKVRHLRDALDAWLEKAEQLREASGFGEG